MVNLLDLTGLSILVPLQILWDGIVGAIPGILGALVVLLTGYVVAWVIGELVTKALVHIKFEKWILDHTGANAYVGSLRLSHLLGVLSKWYTWMLFWLPASNLISLRSVEIFIQMLTLWVPKLIAGILVAIVGFIVAEFVAARIAETRAKSAAIVADIFKVFTIIFTGLTVLRVLGLDVTLAESTFLILVAGVVLGVALAFGIGVGLALKDEAGDLFQRLKKKW